MGAFDDEVRETRQYMDGGRFKVVRRRETVAELYAGEAVWS